MASPVADTPKTPGIAVPPPAPPVDPPDEGGGWGGPDDSLNPAARPLLTNAQLAMLVLIAAEAMFFAGLIGAFFVFRFSGQPWPPPFQPRLPIALTALNTLFLLASSATMVQAQRALRRENHGMLLRFLGMTAGLGALFLLIQGFEWVRLLSFGLTASSGVYGSTFYTIIGTHAFHVFCGVVWLLAVLVRAALGAYSPQRRGAAVCCGMYWHLVVGLWPVLFILVYLI
ncbi:MAG: heme-copper oxidase subunit III [Candidatus Tectomicrobia bacterium]|uniref:Heme-copper oxidase subunit III n=1 Tax=Tectimicrobiota bacterium TaxID=2528274 RepID=A0A932HZM5_UNCTE|nr:heme-copper oxidase subunit III [Candidatus Tectomicrobia bacterium]